MTVLEANQAYRAAMKILWNARLTVHAEHDEIAHSMIVHAQNAITNQEHKDMRRSFDNLHQREEKL